MSSLIGQDLLSQIRSANDIVDVVQWLNVPLQKRGTRWMALCPFHKEKTPSFNVTPQKQSFYCFGCHAGGDVFKFVMMREGMNFMESVHRLADRARITLPHNAILQSGPDRSRRDALYDLMSRVREWYHQNLMRSKSAEHARKYLKSRGFDSQIAKLHMLGYAPSDWSALIEWAKGEKLELDLVQEAGLILEGKRGWYDRFRNRLMIPIADENGRTCGFSGRLLEAEAKEAKYVNSPETPIFHKGRILFGLDRSKRFIQEARSVVICEGQLDWIRCYESGIRNVVAPQGTAFTEEQARILKRYVEDVILCFDSDAAGQKATWRNAELLIGAQLNVRAARIPPGEDPDSLIRKKGAESFQKILGEAMDIFEYRAFSLSKSLDMKQPKNHRRVFEETSPMLALVENEPQRKRMIHNICNILGIDNDAYLVEFEKQRRRANPFYRTEPATATAIPSGGEEAVRQLGDQMLQLALMEQSIATLLADQLEEVWMESYPAKHLLFGVLDRAKKGEWKPSWDGMEGDLSETEREWMARVLNQNEPTSHRQMAEMIQNAITGVRRIYMLNREKYLLDRLKEGGMPDKERLECHSELLDLGRRIKQI